MENTYQRSRQHGKYCIELFTIAQMELLYVSIELFLIVSHVILNASIVIPRMCFGLETKVKSNHKKFFKENKNCVL